MLITYIIVFIVGIKLGMDIGYWLLTGEPFRDNNE